MKNLKEMLNHKRGELDKCLQKMSGKDRSNQDKDCEENSQ